MLRTRPASLLRVGQSSAALLLLLLFLSPPIPSCGQEVAFVTVVRALTTNSPAEVWVHTSGLTVSRPLKAYDRLTVQDGVDAGTNALVTMVYNDGKVQTLGPTNRHWSGDFYRPKTLRAENLGGLMKWYLNKDRIIARGAGARGDKAMALLQLVGADFHPITRSGASNLWSGLIYWAENAPPQQTNQIKLILWARNKRLKEQELTAQWVQSYAGGKLLKATVEISTGDNIPTHFQLGDTRPRGLRNTTEQAWNEFPTGIADQPPVVTLSPDEAQAGAMWLETQGLRATALERYLQIVAAHPRHKLTLESVASFFATSGPGELTQFYLRRAAESED